MKDAIVHRATTCRSREIKATIRNPAQQGSRRWPFRPWPHPSSRTSISRRTPAS